MLGLSQPLQEGPGAGTGDGAEIVDKLLVVHADARVGDGECAGRLVGHEADHELVRAQAAGDFESLKERGRRVARIRLEE